MGLLGFRELRVYGLGPGVGSTPHPVMGTTKDCRKYIKAPSTLYVGAIPRGGLDLRSGGLGFRAWIVLRLKGWPGPGKPSFSRS